jgi:predicted dithiol-disulfide oxidoreductase (DUF899 family)
MTTHEIADRATWLAARKALLAKEKALTRQRDALAAERRKLPWERVERSYSFQAESGATTLQELFAGRSQLLVYHFMFGPDWDTGCKSCSFWVDNIDGALAHLAQRDVSFVCASRAPLAKLLKFRERMGWHFNWVSSLGTSFNFDYQVSFEPEQIEQGTVEYNYRRHKTAMTELPGLSVFFRDDDGSLYHTYSCYSRGLDALNGAYQYLDLLPKGRDEAELSYPMAWVKLHDLYP